MKKINVKNILIIVVIVGIIVLAGIYFIFLNKNNFVELSYNEVLEKVNNKEDFVLCISKTDCSHCLNFKPKLESIANRYNIMIYYTDVDTYSKEDLEKFNVDFSFDGSTPTTLFLHDGKEETTSTRIIGEVSTDRIVDKLKKNGFIK